MTEETLRKRIGKNIQLLRKSAGFKSAAAFAEFAGFETSRYTEYEQGRRSMAFDAAWRIADALDCSLDTLGGQELVANGDPAKSDARGGRANHLLPAEHREEALEDPGDGTRPGRAVPSSGCSA